MKSIINKKLSILKNCLIKIAIFLKEKQYLIYFAAAMGILDFYLRFVNRVMKSFSVLDIIPNTLTIIWVLLFTIMLYIIPRKAKKITTLCMYLIFLVLMITNLIFSRMFSVFFSFKDMLYANEGLKFAFSIFEYIEIIDIVVIMLSLGLIFLSIYSYRWIENENRKQIFKTSIVSLVILVLLLVGIEIKIGKPSDLSLWSAFSNKRNIINQFNDTKRSMMLCGLYEYSFRDFYLTFLHRDKKNYEVYYEEINKYFNNNNKTVSEYNGVFKNKNVIIFMLEDIDTWMLNEKAMPTLYEIQKNSLNFTEHYAANYASGKTFNTEFIANTGLIPNVTTLKTSYSYNQNDYSFSLPNLFKKAGYIVNSIHKNKGSFYNRDNMHLAWGYENHFDFSKLSYDGNLDLDTVLVSSNYDKIIYDDKFMTFYITYSAHMPYNFDKPECKENIDIIKKEFESNNEEYLCAMSQARNTDDAIKLVVEKLKDEGKLSDTILIFFSDHYAYSMDNDMVSKEKNQAEYNLLNKVPFIIYDGGNTINTIDKVNSNIDILPTIADLFGLDYNPNIYFGNSIFSDDSNGIVVFNDHSWYDGSLFYKPGMQIESDYINHNNQYANDILTIGGKIVESDYFRYYDLNNNKKK